MISRKAKFAIDGRKKKASYYGFSVEYKAVFLISTSILHVIMARKRKKRKTFGIRTNLNTEAFTFFIFHFIYSPVQSSPCLNVGR